MGSREQLPLYPLRMYNIDGEGRYIDPGGGGGYVKELTSGTIVGRTTRGPTRAEGAHSATQYGPHRKVTRMVPEAINVWGGCYR